MPFVQAKCENCDAFLEVDSSKKVAICHHCGAPYIVEDAINQFNFNISGLHINGGALSSEITVEMKMKLNAAEASMKMEKYDDALRRFQMLSDDIPQEYRVWWGQIRAITKEFTAVIVDRAELNALCELYDATMHFVPVQNRDKIEHRFMDYYYLQERNREQQNQELRLKAESLEEEYAALQASIEECQQTTYQLYEQAMSFLGPVIFVVFILGFLLSSIGLLVSAVLAFLLCEFVFEPLLKKQAEEWEEEKEKAIEELSESSHAIKMQISEIEEQLRKFED